MPQAGKDNFVSVIGERTPDRWAGALLGFAILRILPAAQESWLWLILPVGLATLLGLALFGGTLAYHAGLFNKKK